MTESKNTYLPEQGEIDRTKIKGYSLRIGAFTSWVKENGYTTSQIAARLNMKEEDLLSKLKEKQLFNREQLRILIRLMGASSACFVIYFPTFELRQQVYFEVFGKELKYYKGRKKIIEKDRILGMYKYLSLFYVSAGCFLNRKALYPPGRIRLRDTYA